MDDEDFFSDVDFDDLPPGTLLQLEQNAYDSTQAAQQASHVPRPDSASRDAGQSNVTRTSFRPPHLHTGLTSDYASLDVGELDAEVVEDEARSTNALGQALVFAEQQHASATQEPQPQQRQQRHQQQRQSNWHERQVPVMGDDCSMYETPTGDPMDEDEAKGSLMEKVDESMVPIGIEMVELTGQLLVERERNRQVMEELAATKSMAATKAGEIAIIRSNQVKLAENFDQQLAALRKANEDEATKRREELDTLRAEAKMMATENAFLRNDLNEEMMRANELKAKSKAAEKAAPVTPRKPKGIPFRDGFDDDEILAVSPSKSASRSRQPSRQPTPVVPGKRKRPSHDSPTKLELNAPADAAAPGPMADPLDEPMLMDTDVDEPAEPVLRPAAIDDKNVRYIKRILDHRTYPREERDLEVMSTWSFPSEPQQKLSSLVLEKTSNLHSGNCVVEYAVVITSLWSRALHERFFTPVPMFMSIADFLLGLDMGPSVSAMIEHLVPVLQDSVDINGIPRFKHSPVFRHNLGQIRQTPQSELQPEVDSTSAMSLLYRVASGCLHIERALEKFWRLIRWDLVLMMLNTAQPIQDIILTMNLLVTSIRGNSFGPIRETEDAQLDIENYIVDRVANLLSEMPQVDEGEAPYMKVEICNMRLEALSLLMAIAFQPMDPNNKHGSFVIASHPTALARIIRAMHDELNALYSYPPERDLHASLVNGLMRLVYGVMKRHEGVDLQSKLGKVAGGQQKFLVVLTRLAFSEGPILEDGIEDETVEMAHGILDDAVNPQEAEALLDAFPSAKQA